MSVASKSQAIKTLLNKESGASALEFSIPESLKIITDFTRSIVPLSFTTLDPRTTGLKGMSGHLTLASRFVGSVFQGVTPNDTQGKKVRRDQILRGPY